MNWTVTFYTALLFFILTPAVLVRLPPKGNKYTVAAFHALVFALVFHFTGKMVWRLSSGMEGFQEELTQQQIDALQQAAKTACAKKGGSWTNNSCDTTNATSTQRDAIQVATTGALAKGKAQCIKPLKDGGWCDTSKQIKDSSGNLIAPICASDNTNGCYYNGPRNAPPGRGFSIGPSIATKDEMQAWGFAN
uniref:Uncharacterized protein n=1 Tax=viral metagenome TaxID=1070528 RepID=A0A6C0JIX3_9ZZZZ